MALSVKNLNMLLQMMGAQKEYILTFEFTFTLKTPINLKLKNACWIASLYCDGSAILPVTFQSSWLKHIEPTEMRLFTSHLESERRLSKKANVWRTFPVKWAQNRVEIVIQ